MPTTFDFDEIIDRRPTASFKWDKYAGKDILPLWVADTDFKSPPAVIEALRRRSEHGVFGYTLPGLCTSIFYRADGVFGIMANVLATYVILFVLFGALLEQAGAGNYFIKVAFAMLGHLKGGPAKAAVVASATTGLISGSSIANVATTGTFTIPLMKRVGFPGTKAGAVEVAGSTNGQLTPPVMGAAAFLMIEYVGISYLEVIKHAILPAVISYIALFYIVHLEALKAQGPCPCHRQSFAPVRAALERFVTNGVRHHE